MKLKKLFLITGIIFTLCLSLGITTNAATEGIYTYSVSNGEAMITDCDTSASGDIVIPTKFGAYPVTSIGASAFFCCDSITTISIPGSITSIGNYAFDGCGSLESMTIPDSVISIGASAFRDCKNIETLTIGSGVKSIDVNAFYKCYNIRYVYAADIKSWCQIEFQDLLGHPLYNGADLYIDGKILKEAVIPEGITEINYAFFNCSTLESVVIPNSVTSISNYAFSGCRKLKSVIIPNGVTNIGEGMFSNCYLLSSIYIPESVTSIGYRAFYNCTSLKSITIPEGVTSIGSYAFNCCDSLTIISIPGSVTSIGNDFMLAIAEFADIYYNGSKVQWDKLYTLSDYEQRTKTIHYFNPIYVEKIAKINENTYSYSFKMSAPEAVCGTYIIALYNGSQLVGLTTETQTEAAVEYTSTGSSITTTATPTSYKLFFWDSLGALTPLCNSVSGEL